MELNITKFFEESCPRDYSASVAEIGNNAGQTTWQAACDDSEDWNFLDSDDKRNKFRAWVQESGGWEAEEIAAWSDTELNALCIQWIAGDIREAGLDSGTTWEQYQIDCEKGQCNSNLYRAEDGAIYWSI